MYAGTVQLNVNITDLVNVIWTNFKKFLFPTVTEPVFVGCTQILVIHINALSVRRFSFLHEYQQKSHFKAKGTSIFFRVEVKVHVFFQPNYNAIVPIL